MNKNTKITLSPYDKTLLPLMYQLFYDTVHTINALDYTQEQLQLWATGTLDFKQWHLRFSSCDTLVATYDGILVGFGSMEDTGYLDMLYVHKDYQKRGIAREIVTALEEHMPLPQYTVHASLTARGFFEKMGYVVQSENQVIRQGVALVNLKMMKNNIC